MPNVAGEKLSPDRGSNPRPFTDHANTLPLSYRTNQSSQTTYYYLLPSLVTHTCTWYFGIKKVFCLIIFTRKLHIKLFHCLLFVYSRKWEWLDKVTMSWVTINEVKIIQIVMIHKNVDNVKSVTSLCKTITHVYK